MGVSDIPADWQPTAEQIERWLGRFTAATLRRELAAHQDWPKVDPEVDRVEEEAFYGGLRVGGGVFGVGVLALLAVAMAFEPTRRDGRFGEAAFLVGAALLLIGVVAAGAKVRDLELKRAGVPPRERERVQARTAPATVDTTVWADGRRVGERTRGVEQVVAWHELVAIEDHGDDVLLRTEFGESLRLPRHAGIEPVLRAAQHVVAARAAHEESLSARMERALSRPEFDERSDRGLSVADH